MNLTFNQEPLRQFRKRVLQREVSSLNTGWEDILVPQGLMIAGVALEDYEMVDYVERWARHHLESGIRTQAHTFHEKRPSGFFLNDYCGDWALPLVFAPLYSRTSNPLYLDPIRQYAEHLLTHAVRLKDGIMAHGGWEYGRKTVWVDTLYYAASVLAASYQATLDQRYADEAVRQCILHSEALQDPGTGCYFHDVEPESGRRTTSFWSRGNGWILMSLADTLRRCPSTTIGWEQVMSSYRKLVAGILRYQHPCGLWRIVPECESSHLETSGTAMILVGLTTGLSQDWIDLSVKQSIQKGTEELLTWIRPRDGALVGAQRPAGLGGWETHKLSAMDECTYATGMLLRLVGEIKSSGMF